jgi:RNA polymerase sigma-70 factor, ECF subfamily
MVCAGMSQEISDTLLLDRFAKGDAASLGEIARRYEGPLLGLSRGLLRGREDLAREAVQDAWVRVIKGATYFDKRAKVRTWLYRIVINRCSDIRARELQGINGAATDLPAPARDTDATTDLRAAVEGLPESRRLVLLLCYHRGLTHEQAAEVLDLPVGTLKTRLHAALETLRGVLKPEPKP